MRAWTRNLKPGDSAAFQFFQLMIITLEKKAGYTGKEQLVPQMVSNLRMQYSGCQLMTPEVGAPGKRDCRSWKTGRASGNPGSQEAILKCEIMK